MEQLREIILVGLTVAVGELYQCLMVPAYSTANSFIYGQNNAFILMQDSFPQPHCYVLLFMLTRHILYALLFIYEQFH